MGVCVVADCNSSTTARGWCNKHYKRWRTYGDPLVTVTRPRDMTLPEAFLWHQTTICPDQGCWDWLANTDEDGYGVFHYGVGANIRAHRASYMIYNGEIPEGQLVLHSCDRPVCVQPSHLSLGDNDENMRQGVERQRFLRGIDHHNAKLTPDVVRKIRQLYADGVKKKPLGRQFGVSDMAISRILSGKTWSHVS